MTSRVGTSYCMAPDFLFVQPVVHRRHFQKDSKGSVQDGEFEYVGDGVREYAKDSIRYLMDMDPRRRWTDDMACVVACSVKDSEAGMMIKMNT